jgi:beta-mannosidase
MVHRIQDPFVDMNELQCQWVSESSWTYKTQLLHVPSIPSDFKVVLAMDGLDTFAKVLLNGKTLLESNNMFLSHRLDITKDMTTERENTLEVQFDSAFKKARQIRETYPKHEWLCWNGDTSRLAVRKAQYHW